MGRILAIDYGSKRCGIAVTDELQLIASGLTTVSTDDLMSFLDDYFRQEKVTEVLVGEPRQKDGTHSPIENEIRDFISKFEEKFKGMPLHRADERFTSKMAFQSMIDGGLKKKKRQDKALIDEISATIILQDYLNRKGCSTLLPNTKDGDPGGGHL